MGALALLGKIPYVKEIAVCMFVFVVGLAIGNAWATSKAIKAATEATLDFAARQQASISEALLAERKKEENAEKVELARQHEADTIVHTQLTSQLTAATTDANRSRQFLAQERKKTTDLSQTNEGLRNVNQMLANEMQKAPPPSPQSCGDASVRLMLDQASGANARDSSPGNGNATPGSAPGATGEAGASTQAAELTCDQLQDGYINLGEWGRRGWDKYEAWQAWATKNALVP